MLCSRGSYSDWNVESYLDARYFFKLSCAPRGIFLQTDIQTQLNLNDSQT